MCVEGMWCGGVGGVRCGCVQGECDVGVCRGSKMWVCVGV